MSNHRKQMQSELTPPFPRQHQTTPGAQRKLTPQPRFLAPDYRAAGKLEGKVALISGGDSGIGRAVAVIYAREGADVSNFGNDNPSGRPAQTEELAPACVFLASDADSSYITGIVLQVMAGETTGA